MLFSDSPFSEGQGRKYAGKKYFRVEIRTGTSFTNYCHGQKGLSVKGIKCNLLPVLTDWNTEEWCLQSVHDT